MAEVRARRTTTFPPLGWFARHDPRDSTVKAWVGARVEVGPDHLVEGVWDRPFEPANFHTAGHFFGSGLRADGEAVWVVPSHAPVDRVFVARDGETLLVSNSLPAMLGMTGARLRPDHDYRGVHFSLLKGLSRTDRRIPVRHARFAYVEQHLRTPLRVVGGRIDPQPLIAPDPFPSFEAYRAALVSALARIAENARSPGRAYPLALISTISSGYDSAAVTALTRDLGLTRVYTTRRAWYNVLPLLGGRFRDDDGSGVAAVLGVERAYLRGSGDGHAEEELAFYATSPSSAELALHPLAVERRRAGEPAVLLSGHGGGRVWDVHTTTRLSDGDLARKDLSGLGLSEPRLMAGVIHVPVPFMFAGAGPSVAAVSRSDAMRPWRVHNRYDRPIPRRILEEAGVRRSEFGWLKRGILGRREIPVDRETRRAFYRHLRERFGVGRPELGLRLVRRRLLRGVRRVEALVREAARRPSPWKAPAGLFPGVDLTHELYVWSVNRLADGFSDNEDHQAETGRGPATPAERGGEADAAWAGHRDGSGREWKSPPPAHRERARPADGASDARPAGQRPRT